ncbi:MAG: DUF3955 domain-containing protein [Burkholderiaceae bacterium]
MSIPQTVTAVLALISALCFGTFRAIGSEVDALGVLREPFFLIPIGWLFAAASLLAGLFAIVHTIRSARDTTYL